MQAYVISLNTSSTPANAALATRLAACGMTPAFIRAVSGKTMDPVEYYLQIQAYHRARGLIISPSELGCTLSHRAACEALLATSQPGAFIFEDDVCLHGQDEQAFRQVMALGSSGFDFIHLGGMDGHEASRDRMRADLVHAKPPVFSLELDDLHMLMRTAGYWISRSLAEQLVRLPPFLADDYVYLREKLALQRLYYCDLVSHPIAMTTSTIESERSARHRLDATRPNHLPSLWRVLLTQVIERIRLRLSRFRREKDAAREIRNILGRRDA